MRAPGWFAVAVALGALAGLAGCRQIFGIDDTHTSMDAPAADGAVVIADAPITDAPADAIPPDAPTDAPVDAVPFSPAMCPAGYDLTIASSPNSRYRALTANRPFANHNTDCNSGHPGWTHLIALDDMAEADAAAAFNAGSIRYVGAVQAPGQTTPAAAWFRMTGEPVATAWSTSLGVEPDDLNDVENDEQNLAVIQADGKMFDVGGLSQYDAICECDGKPVDPTVATYLPP